MTDSPTTPSTKGDPQGPSIHVDSGTPSSTSPAAVPAPAAPGEPAPGANLLSTGAGAPSVLGTAVATAAGSSHHPSPESQSSSEAGSLSRSGTSTEHNVSHMGGGFPSSSGNVSPCHGIKRPASEIDPNDLCEEYDETQAPERGDAEPDPVIPSREQETTVSGPWNGENKAKRIKRMNGVSDNNDDDDDDNNDNKNNNDNNNNDGDDNDDDNEDVYNE